MPIWTTSSNSSNTSLGFVIKTRTATVTYNANGLKPNSQYKFWCNGTEMTWACRTPGTRLGAGLVSDQYGSMTVLFHAEMIPDSTLNQTSGTTVKYNNMYLTDINGKVSSLSVSKQTFVRKQ